MSSGVEGRAVSRGIRLALAIFGSAIALVLSIPPSAIAADPSPVGRWLTISDRTHAPTGIIEIKLDHGTLKGTVVQLLNRPPQLPPAICGRCEGPLKNAPVVGLTILWGLKNNGGTNWEDGSILDPNSGDTYSATVELANGGQKLVVRGYLGISLFGRSQTWIRQS